MRRLRPWLELIRISNLPTVWAGVIHGFVATDWIARQDLAVHPAPSLLFHLDQAFVLLVAASLIYCAGMILNDAVDADVDAAERPGRPIPSGRVRRGTAFAAAATLLAAGGCATLVYKSQWVFQFSLLLIVLVLLYNFYRSYRLLAYIWMAGCRASLVLVGGSAFAWLVGSDAWWIHIAVPAGIIGAYTGLICIVAHDEAGEGRQHRQAVAMKLIAAMPLVHSIFLGVIGAWQAVLFCVACSLVTWVGQRRIAGS